MDKNDKDEILPPLTPPCSCNHKDCAAQDTSEAGALLFPCTPSLLRGRWGTFLGCSSSSSTLGINPLQLCPLLRTSLPLPSHLYLPPSVLSSTSWPVQALNAFFTSYSRVAQIKQTSLSPTFKHTCIQYIPIYTNTYIRNIL